jgi:3-dehydroquinate synthase
MPASFDIASKDGSYRVSVESGLAARALSRQDEAIVLHDAFFAALVAPLGNNSVSIVADERHKSLDALPAVISRMRELGANRHTHLIAIGGGVIQDIAAFCAAVFMRGLSWSYLPTTLLAMADSCIGGKSSINVGGYKNLVGTINPPKQVLIDPDFVRTLSDEQMVDGFCEAAKICFCRDAKTFEKYLALDARPGMAGQALETMLCLTLDAKRWFIEIDEFDRRERLLLNFGHTFGHAIESASDFRMSHGCAVGLGMLCAINLGAKMGVGYSGCASVRRLEKYIKDLLATVPHTANRLAGVTAQQCLAHCLADKKHETNNFVFIVVNSDGVVERRRLAKTVENRRIIVDAFAEVLGKYQS